MADANRTTVDITTGIGTFCFPHLYPSTASKKDSGEKSYDIQILIPKTQREDVRALLRAIKTVGEAKWGAEKWKKVRQPLRDGDKEAEEFAEDGQTKGEKYPERLGCFFLNARSNKPVGVYDRQRNPIPESEASTVYGGAKGKIAVTFYPYSTSGNVGIGVGLNGVQKIADGESFGGGAPSVESMFDMLEDDDDSDLGVDDFGTDEPEPEVEEEKPAPAKKAAAKKAPAKKAAAKKAAPAPEPADDADDLGDVDPDEEDLFDDI